MNANPREQHMVIGRYKLAFLASVAGFIAFYILVIAWGYFSSLIDPSARLHTFLFIPPRHPVRLEAAALLLHCLGGVLFGVILTLLTALTHHTQRWVAWLFSIGGFLASILITMPPGTRWQVMPVVQIAVFVVTSAISVKVFTRLTDVLPELRHADF